MSTNQQMLRDAETLSADAFKAKWGLHEGNFTPAPATPVATTRPKNLQQVPESELDRAMTPEEEALTQRGAVDFFTAHPQIVVNDETIKLFQAWFEKNRIFPTLQAFNQAFEEIAENLTYTVAGRTITPEDIPALPADTFAALTKRQSGGRATEPLDKLSAAQLKEHIADLEDEDSLRGEATLVAVTTLYPRGTTAGDQARRELTALRMARRNDLTKIPGIAIGQRERLISTVLEQRAYLLNGFSRDEVSDALLTHLENCRQTWSLQSLNAAAEQLEEWGDLPRRNSPVRAGVTVREHPTPEPRNPFAHPVEVVERTERLTRQKLDAMSADDFAKACLNPEFLKAMNEL